VFNPYIKAVIAVIAAVFGALAVGYDDSILTTSEIVIAVGAAFVAGWAAWAAKPVWAKAIAAASTAGLAQLAIALQDDMMSAQEVVTLGVVTVGALAAVYQIPNSRADNQPGNG
jgi:uncharacterized membrane protein